MLRPQHPGGAAFHLFRASTLDLISDISAVFLLFSLFLLACNAPFFYKATAMDRFRMIRPNDYLSQQHHLQTHSDQGITSAEGVGSEVSLGSKRKTRHRHTEEEWEAIRPDLAELLLSHGLEDAAKTIKQTHNFEAG